MLFRLLGLALLAAPALAQPRPLVVPPLLEGPTFDLQMRRDSVAFREGARTPTMGFNGAFLGPTLVWNRGETVRMDVANGIGEPTTVHWHGAHVAAIHDGGPHTVIAPGAVWSPEFEVLDQASTLWYHPHLHMKTQDHVQYGLAGMILVRDAEEAALDLPRTYGVDDVPVILQDRSFDAENQFVIESGQHATRGDVMLTNGVEEAYFDAPAQLVRLRVLNASSIRVYNVGLDGDRTFWMVGSDGGLLEAPVPLTRLRLAVGERAELLVDLGGLEGQTVRLRSFASELTNGEPGSTGSGPLDGADFDLLQLRVGSPTPEAVTALPTQLVTLERYDEGDVDVTREFQLGPGLTINNRKFAMSRIDETVRLGDTEVWEISTLDVMPHPFHIHDVQFYILDRNGVPPPPEEAGRKDVVLVYPNETVRFITRFDDHADPNVPYMYHCHFLAHEDGGMMGQFVVVDPNANEPIFGPSEVRLSAAVPNPVRGKVLFSFELDEPGQARLALFDAVGREVAVVFDGPARRGLQTRVFDARRLAAGAYVVRLESARGAASRPFTVID